MILILAILLSTLALSLYSGEDVYVFGCIMALVFAISGPRRHNWPWGELGLKREFVSDLGRVWYYAGIDAVLFQLLPPTLGVAYVFGYLPELLRHITDRISIDFGSLSGAYAIVSILAAALVLTLVEEVVFRAFFHERLSWFIDTPAAIILASALFGSVHYIGAAGGV